MIMPPVNKKRLEVEEGMLNNTPLRGESMERRSEKDVNDALAAAKCQFFDKLLVPILRRLFSSLS